MIQSIFYSNISLNRDVFLVHVTVETPKIRSKIGSEVQHLFRMMAKDQSIKHLLSLQHWQIFNTNDNTTSGLP